MPRSSLALALAASLVACGTAQPSPPAANASAESLPAASAPSAAAARPAAPGATFDPERAKTEQAAAERCLFDPRCALADAQRLYADALDHGSTASCELFYRGDIVAKDWSRARACYERRFATERGCDGSSPETPRLVLVTMLLTGQGGPKAPSRVPPLLRGCYEDVSAEWLNGEISKRGEGASTIDFCADVGGTTLTMNQCGLEGVQASVLGQALARKELAARFDDDVLRAEEVLAKAFGAYLATDVAAHVFPMQTGTIAPLIASGAETTDRSDYALYLTEVAALRAPLDAAAKDDAVTREGEALAAALKNAEDADWRAAIRLSESEFQRYAKAASAFEARALGPAYADDALARLSLQRIERIRALVD